MLKVLVWFHLHSLSRSCLPHRAAILFVSLNLKETVLSLFVRKYGWIWERKQFWTFCLENSMHENYLLLRKAMSNWRLRDDVFIGNTNQVIEDPGTRVGHIFHPGYHQIQLSFNERWPSSVGITPKLLQTCFSTQKNVSYSYPAIFLQNIAFLMRGERETWIWIS